MRLMRSLAFLGVTSAFWPHVMSGQPKISIDPQDITNLEIRTGVQARVEMDNLLGTNENVRAADDYFKNKGLSLRIEGLTWMRFFRISTKETVMAVYIPYATTPPTNTLLNVTVWVRSPKGTNVWAGTAVVEGKEPLLKEDIAVEGGKIQPGKGKLREWFKCVVGGCGPSLATCVLSDGLYMKCVAISCTASALFCVLSLLM